MGVFSRRYKLPGFKDIPIDFSVELLRNAPNERAVYSSKAVGEVCEPRRSRLVVLSSFVCCSFLIPVLFFLFLHWIVLQPPLFLGASVFFAIKEAVRASRCVQPLRVQVVRAIVSNKVSLLQARVR